MTIQLGGLEVSREMEIPVVLRTPMLVVQVNRETEYGSDEPKIDKRTGKKVWRASVVIPDPETNRAEQMVIHITDDNDWSQLSLAQVSGLRNGRVVFYGAGNKSASLRADGFVRLKGGDSNAD